MQNKYVKKISINVKIIHEVDILNDNLQNILKKSRVIKLLCFYYVVNEF